MKKFVLCSVILAALFLTQSAIFAKTQTIKKYDSHGSYQGKLVTDGNKTKIYQKNNNYDGYYKQDGNRIKQYNKNGDFEGSYKK